MHANHFSYDAMLRRTAVEDSAGVRYFTWDTNGMNLLAERDATGTVVAGYTHGRAAVDGIGSCVGQKLVQSGATYYECDICDHRGSVVRRVNAAGQVTGYFEYDAWGNYLRDEETGASSRFRYQSNWIELADDPDGVLYLSPTRVYHAGVGRFLGREPLGRQGGNYQYARSTPGQLLDPDGLAEAGTGGERPKPRPLDPLPAPDVLPLDFDLRPDPFTLGLTPEGRVTVVRVDAPMSQTMKFPSGETEVQGWNARYELRIRSAPQCTVSAVVKVKVEDPATPAPEEITLATVLQSMKTAMEISSAKAAWKEAIETKWGGRFRLCCPQSYPGCPKGLAVLVELLYVAHGEDYVVTPRWVQPSRELRYDLKRWPVDRPTGAAHEFGHILGNKDEYFTVDGVVYDPPDPTSDNVMSHSMGSALPRHYSGMAKRVASDCVVKPLREAQGSTP